MLASMKNTFKKDCCVKRSNLMQQTHMLCVALCFIGGLITFIFGITMSSEFIALVSLIPLTIALIPIFIIGPPYPFVFREDYSFVQLYVNESACTRQKMGQFWTAFFCVSAPSLIFLLAHLTKISVKTAILTISGELILTLSVIIYLCIFHTPKSVWLSDDEDVDDL